MAFPDVPGAAADAETWEEVGNAAYETLVFFIETKLAQGDRIPAPSVDTEFLLPTQADFDRARAGLSAANGRAADDQ